TIPTKLKFARDKPIGRVRGVVLTKGLVRRVTRRLEVALERLQDFIVALRLLPICFQRRVDRPRFEYTEQFVLDCIVHANAAERDTWRLATVEPTTKACVTRSIVILAGVIDHHLRPQRRQRLNPASSDAPRLAAPAGLAPASFL